jgi:hypothetical protein
MSWEEYRQPRHLKNNTPQVRIKADGTCFISSLAYNTFFWDYDNVILCHDWKRDLIGFVPIKGEGPRHSRKIRPVKSKKGTTYGARISAKGFFEYIGVKENRCYNLEKEEMPDGKPILVAIKQVEECSPKRDS